MYVSGYLIEAYRSPSAAKGAAPAPADVARAADQLSREGQRVRLIQTLFVPEDETCFYLFEAQSRQTVLAAARPCGLRFERLVQAESEWTGI
jgi:hypothetical protein